MTEAAQAGPQRRFSPMPSTSVTPQRSAWPYIGIGRLTPCWPHFVRTLREDFCKEVLSQLCDEWRLSRTAILRWVYEWCLQCGIIDVPAVVREMPTPANGYWLRKEVAQGWLPSRRLRE